MKNIFYLLFSFLILYSCRSRKFSENITNPSPYFSALMEGHDNTVFHGIDFNLQQDDIRKIEKAKLYERTTDHLFYSYVFPKDSTPFSEYADIEYFFDKAGKMEIITSSIYANDSLQQKFLIETFHQYFNNRYGEPKKDDYGYDVWKGTMEASDDDYDYSVGMSPLNDEYGIKLEYLRD